MGETGAGSELTGKKIFFLYPTAVVQNRIITELVQLEYEVYIARNRERLRKAIKKFPDAIIFVDINEQMTEKEWEAWITGMMEAKDTSGVSIGIITANDDEQTKRKYLLALKVRCGYTVLGHDLKKAIIHIISVLDSVDSKGRRKYLRANIEKGSNTTLNLLLSGSFVNGQINDISAVGISCTLEGNPEIPKNSLFKDIQIKLQTSLLKVEGIVFGSRVESRQSIYVILFTQRIDPDVRIKIHEYIQKNLQKKMDFEIN